MKTIMLILCSGLVTTVFSQTNTFPSSGNVGIGTTSPGSVLTVKGRNTGISIQPGGNPYFGTLAFNRESATGQIFDSSGNAFQINNGGTDKNLHFQVWNGSGSQVTNNALVITGSDANVGIGTATPAEKLSVNGNIRSKKLIITQTGWSDYVFDSTYQLKPLTEIEQFIKDNKHLPDVPSATEVTRDGVDVGNNQALLLKKIEELTLYIIEMKKESEEMKKGENVMREDAAAMKKEIEVLQTENAQQKIAIQ